MAMAFAASCNVCSTGWKLTIISDTLLYVPTMRPAMPIRIRTMFFHRWNLTRPKLSGHNTQISISDGNAMPSIERQNAPNSEMKSARRGTEMANKTTFWKQTEKVVMSVSI